MTKEIMYKKGNLVDAFKDGEVGAIAHQSNCFCTMGSGVALAIKNAFPEAYEADCGTKKGDKEKLGNLSVGESKYGPVFNLYGQYNYGKDGKQYTDYMALYGALSRMAEILQIAGFTGKIGLPKIGAGTGGGDWNIIEEIIKDKLSNWEIIVYVL